MKFVGFRQLFGPKMTKGAAPDAAISLVIFLIVVMLIVPLPTFSIDILVFLSITLSVITLMMTIYVEDAVAFSTYPVLLLILAIWRIALSVATTRNILVDGDAGEIITAFGEVAISGNVIVGVVIFFLITIVQFVVINKGSERVAEVGARFTLDSMPGKQMSIDADLRSGAIDVSRARQLRAHLAQESQFHGAMDGSMKFLKGDAIAGLLMVFVNFLGGLFIGTVESGLSFKEVIDKYTILSIGDALVGQIPAIFTAVSAGILVTRVTHSDPSGGAQGHSESLSEQVVKQFRTYSKALFTSSILVTFIGFFPGFPTFMCFCFALGCFGAFILAENANQIKADDHFSELVVNPDLPPLRVMLAPGLLPAIGGPLLLSEMKAELSALAERYGVPLPRPEVTTDARIAESDYVMTLGETPVIGGQLSPGRCYAINCEKILSICGISFERLVVPEEAGEYYIVENEAGAKVKPFGATIYTPREFLLYRVRLLLLSRLGSFIDVDVVRQRLNQYNSSSPDSAKELNKLVQPLQIREVFARLASEQVPLTDARVVLHKMLDVCQREKDTNAITRALRIALADRLTFHWLSSDGCLYSIQLTAETQQFLQESLRETPQGDFLAIGMDVAHAIAASVSLALKKWELDLGKLVMIVPGELRSGVRRLLEFSFPHLAIIAVEEIRRDIRVEVFHIVDPNEQASEVAGLLPEID
jgi:type III secretion protein V